MSGKNNLTAPSPSTPLPSPQISRAAQKLADFVGAAHFDFTGRTVLDIGSSTGGFTQLALLRGAARVIAVEKGTRQLSPLLRSDPRIELHEKTDIFDLRFIPAPAASAPASSAADFPAPAAPVAAPAASSAAPASSAADSTADFPAPAAPAAAPAASAAPSAVAPSSFNSAQFASAKPPAPLTLSAPIDVVLADLSFVSLRRVLRAVAPQLPQADFLVMLKPQFEATPDQLRRGVLKNSKIRRAIIHDFENWLLRHRFIIKYKRDNQLPGKSGNLERFYWLRFVPQNSPNSKNPEKSQKPPKI